MHVWCMHVHACPFTCTHSAHVHACARLHMHAHACMCCECMCMHMNAHAYTTHACMCGDMHPVCACALRHSRSMHAVMYHLDCFTKNIKHSLCNCSIKSLVVAVSQEASIRNSKPTKQIVRAEAHSFRSASTREFTQAKLRCLGYSGCLFALTNL